MASKTALFCPDFWGRVNTLYTRKSEKTREKKKRGDSHESPPGLSATFAKGETRLELVVSTVWE